MRFLAHGAGGGGDTHDRGDGGRPLLQLLQVQRLLGRRTGPGVAGRGEEAGPWGEQPGTGTQRSQLASPNSCPEDKVDRGSGGQCPGVPPVGPGNQPNPRAWGRTAVPSATHHTGSAQKPEPLAADRRDSGTGRGAGALTTLARPGNERGLHVLSAQGQTRTWPTHGPSVARPEARTPQHSTPCLGRGVPPNRVTGGHTVPPTCHGSPSRVPTRSLAARQASGSVILQTEPALELWPAQPDSGRGRGGGPEPDSGDTVVGRGRCPLRDRVGCAGQQLTPGSGLYPGCCLGHPCTPQPTQTTPNSSHRRVTTQLDEQRGSSRWSAASTGQQ